MSYGRIDIFNPERMVTLPIALKLGHGWHYLLDYSWVIQQVIDFSFSGSKILEVGSGSSGLGKEMGRRGLDVTTVDRDGRSNADHVGDFLSLDLPENYDVVMWVSSIEHQETIDQVKACVDKSMDLLAPGGVFLATFGLSQVTGYDGNIKGWNFSIKDAMRVFDCPAVSGKYDPIWHVYRDNKFDLRDKYVDRFQRWDGGTPHYIAAGAVRVK